MTEAVDITRALMELSAGDHAAMDRLLPRVYDQLRGLARRALGRERPDHSLSATGLVHEAYLKLVQLDQVNWQGRAHFFAACAGEMRRILIDHARARAAAKRGGGMAAIPIEDVVVAANERPGELVALDDALKELEQLSPRQARVVECRFFAGMSVEETAAALELSPASIKRDWTLARAFLNRALSDPDL